MTFYTGRDNIFYLELAIDRTEFIKLYDFEPHAVPNPDELIEQAHNGHAPATQTNNPPDDNDDLLAALGM